ncbi:Gfo/Idh/MocA family protein [Athalassotoga saccharophila]|uniref:Gfo/Idh/MocA family protein n=1 Tax=Athalassotoga saccharophila TaxID=1441386 RepID=UPI00137AC6B0|nr:Gfo/Idh/MocA family oxidoreductase [Athalassotoga saccharophila]BBJ27651.1 glucose-6-phosphate 3-dehydrogenase [Athalassotoga saccharophila]
MIKYGLSGLGGIARIHLMAIKNMKLAGSDVDVELEDLYSTSPLHRKEGADLGFKHVTDRFESIFNHVDVVDICTPNFLHKDQIVKSLEAQKDVYCEKPLAMNSNETSEIVKVLSSHRVKNQIAFMLRFIPAVAMARSIVKQGMIGKVYAFRGEFFHSSYLDRSKPMSWRLEKSKSGGGSLVDLGSHIIDLTLFLLGDFEEVHSSFKTIIEKRKNGFEEKTVDVDDWALLYVKLKSGPSGTLEASRLAAGKEGMRFEIYASNGTLFIDTNDPYRAKVFDEYSRMIYPSKEDLTDDFYRFVDQNYPSPKLSSGFMVDAHMTSLIAFFKSLKENVMVPTFEDGHKVQVIMDKVYSSDKSFKG